MVKINKSDYTPIIQNSDLSQVESRIDVATNQANGLVDASLRNVTSTQNQAARDRLQANEDAFRHKIGLSDAYFATKQNYLKAVKILKDIDETNQAHQIQSAAKAFTLREKERISLTTLQFYEEAKRKDPLNLVESTQEFINAQIEESVKNAPNDKAVLDLYADMSEYKVSKIGEAIKDKAKASQEYLDISIADAKNITASHLRMSPTIENYSAALNKFANIGSILSDEGFSEDQVGGIYNSYRKDITEAFIGGMMDAGNVESVKSALSNSDIQAALGDSAQKIIKDARALEGKLIEQHSKELVKSQVLNLYGSGKSPAGIDGAEKVVYEENINVLQSLEGQLDKLGAANGSTLIENYLSQNSEYIPAKTLEYIANKAIYGSDLEMAAYSAGVVKLLNNKATAKQFSKLGGDTVADIVSTGFYLEALGDVSKVKTIKEQNQIKLNQLGGKEAISSIKQRAYEDIFGSKSTNFSRGEEVLDELRSSEWISNDVGDQDIELLGSRFDQAFSEMLVRTGGNSDAAYRAALDFIKATNIVTDVNGYDQVMKNSPTKLGIFDTQEGKDLYEETFKTTKKKLLEDLNIPDLNVAIAPVPFVTGNELDGTVNYALVKRETGESILVNNNPVYMTLDTRFLKESIDKKNIARLKERERLLDLSNKAWSKIEKANKTTVIGK